jgi:hypothetical protein
VSASTERLVRTVSTLAHSTESIVNLLAVLVRVRVESLCSSSFGVAPPSRIPSKGFRPDMRVNLANSCASENVVAFRNNIGAVFRRRSESRRDGNVGTDVAHDAVNWGMHAKSLANDRVQNRKFTKLFICHAPERSIRVAEILDLFLVESFPIAVMKTQYQQRCDPLTVRLGCLQGEEEPKNQ